MIDVEEPIDNSDDTDEQGPPETVECRNCGGTAWHVDSLNQHYGVVHNYRCRSCPQGGFIDEDGRRGGPVFTGKIPSWNVEVDP